ncbi:receptor-like protein 9DC3 [Gossypium hirsutum]|uniref:Receptor-like protein 9DC3 n=1 Tax=Gossypium hirsutum TaxID=3635 RepID=A0ABM3A1M3_GOSHI|nr:receptor-like protein 9DC3 [Gossypium hirsutum]
MQEVGNGSLTYLKFLDLSSNLIRGNLPIPASTIRVFLISNNSFNGEVSSLICNATYLQILDLSHNYLSGSIPQCFGNLSYWLEFLNLKKNKFYGTIPPAFAKGCQLSNFNLNGNLLEGPLTPSILNCRGLEVLDLGNNKINDTFPHWLGSLPFLQVLVLKAIINLEKIGSTMSYMGVNCPGSGFYTYSIGIVMKGQDMDLNNQFEGGIPEVFGKLNLLKGLNLSHNNLNGGIPTSIGNLTSLEWLDLSSNRFLKANSSTHLEMIHMKETRENKLHGQIPQGKQFNTFGNDSYEGNKGLCGFPVSKGCNIIEPPPLNVLEKDGSKSNITFGWKVVLIGYGCGVVFGMSVGYVVFQTGKPKWLVNLLKSNMRRSEEESQRMAVAEMDEEGSS